MKAAELHLTVVEQLKIRDADSSAQPYLILTKLDRSPRFGNVILG
jgi:hypothetical protein